MTPKVQQPFRWRGNKAFAIVRAIRVATSNHLATFWAFTTAVMFISNTTVG